jgi:hypothetical protein
LKIGCVGLQASIAASGLIFSWIFGTNGDLNPVYDDAILKICTLLLVGSIASRLYHRFKAAGHDPVPDPLQYLSRTVTGGHRKRSIAIDQIGYSTEYFTNLRRPVARSAQLPWESAANPMPFRPKINLSTLERTRTASVVFLIPLSVLAQISPMPPQPYADMPPNS